MPFAQTDAERAKLGSDTTPWSEAALAVHMQGRRTTDVTVIAKGTLLEVAGALIDQTPAQLRSVRVTLPDRRHAGHRFEGPALVNLIARARALIGAAAS